MRDGRGPDPVAVLMACAYFAALGWLVGRMMMRSEQARDAELSSIRRQLFELQSEVYQPKPAAEVKPAEVAA